MGLAIAIVTMLWVGASAQTGCMSAIISLSPCLNYVTGSSSTPSSSCCTQLASVVSSQVQCLCTVLNGSSSLGITINQTRALALPSACNVQTPPTSQCNGEIHLFFLLLVHVLLFFFYFFFIGRIHGKNFDGCLMVENSLETITQF